MTDLASLGLRIESQEVDTAERRLDGLTASAGRTERATEALTRETQRAMAGFSAVSGAVAEMDRRVDALRSSIDPLYQTQRRLDAELAEAASLYRMGALTASEYDRAVSVLTARQTAATTAQNALNMAQARGARAAGFTAAESLNLSRQLADVGVSAAMGMNPLMILIQQGTQIGDIFATARARGVGFGAAMRGLVASAGPLLPILAALGAAAGTFAAIFAAGAQQINRNAGDITKSLGLTEDQMKRVKNTGVTMGDTIGATFEVLGDRIWGVIGPTMTAVGRVIGETYQNAVDGAVWFAKETMGVFTGAFGAIKAVWSMLPGAIGDIMIQTANGVLRVVEDMVNRAIALLNTVIEMANLVAQTQGYRGPALPSLREVRIGEVDNPFKGMAQDTMSAAAKAFEAERETGRQMIGDLLADIQLEAIENARERIRKEAGDPKKKTGGASEAERELQRRIRASEDYIASLREETDTLGMNAVAAKEYEIAQQAALAPTKALREEIERTGDGLIDKMRLDIANTQAMDDAIAMMDLERQMIAATNVERAVALAQLAEEQRQRLQGGEDQVNSAAGQTAIARAGEVAKAQALLTQAQRNYNDALDHTLVLLEQIDAHAKDAASGLVAAFEGLDDSLRNTIKGLTGVVTAMTELSAREEAIRRRREEDRKAAGDDVKRLAQIDMLAARESEQARVSAYGSMAAAAKGFFEEGSAGYKAMQAAEIAFRAVEFALSVRAMFQNATETAASVANSGTKATASVTAGVAKLFEEGGWFGFVGAGAFLALMASLGFSGGGGAVKQYDLEGVQSRQGTGSILGDSKAKSDSIARSLEIVAANTNRDLEYSNAMLKALRAIEGTIEVVAAAIARSLSLSGGAFDPQGVNQSRTITGSATNPYGGSNIFKTIFAPGAIDPLGLFNTSVTRKLVDAGIAIGAQTVAEAMQGLDAAYFQTIQTRTAKKAFGITYSDKTSTRTNQTPVEEELARQFSLVIASLRDGVIAAANVLGVEGAGAVLDSFKINLGNISFKDMNSQEITDTLNAVFSKLGDDMAAAVIPGLTEVQKAGEGLFETLMRVAREYQVIDVTLASIGMTFGAVGLSSVAARQRLVDLFGSLDDFVEQTSFYAENFLTEAERLAPIQSAVTAELNRLGLSSVKTRDQFKAIVQGLDVSTSAGAELYAALMALAPAFAAITEETTAIREARDQLSTAYERESGALLDTIDRFTDLASSLSKYRASLYSGPAAALSPEEQYRAARSEFDRVQALAATGDQQALGDLQSVSEAYLEASRAYYASSQGYFDDLARVRDAVTAAELVALDQVDVAEAQLDELKALVSGFLDINESVISVREAVEALAELLNPALPQTPLTWPGEDQKAAGGSANDNTAVVDAITALQDQMAEISAQIAAGNSQSGAIHAETIAAMREQLEVMQRQLRELQAA
ncbi:MAG: phage tail length tape measure family protein [Caulobacter sp.]